MLAQKAVSIIECAPGEASMSVSLRRWTAGLALAALVAAGAPVCLADELEYRVKAEFIERFTHFVDWPPGALEPANQPFVVCVIGESPLTSYLERMARDRRIKERRIDLRRIKAPADGAACHVLVIGAGERPRLRQILNSITGRPVLSVGDAEGFAKEGVLINFVVDDEGRVRFEICATELKRSGLKINVQLLRMARVVVEGTP
jgi:hypothetical protein